ncbi:MAG TPA: DNA-binding protein [Geobacteraceae bacterium]
MKRIQKVVAIVALSLAPAFATAMPEMATMGGAAPPQQSAQPPLAGTVVETMNSGGYTYMLLQQKDTKSWVAVPEMYVKVGEEIELEPGVQMGEFVSKALGKTFESIVFSNGPTDKFTEQRKKSAHSGVVMDSSKKVEGKKAGKVVENLKVEKAAGANAYTVAEVFAKRDALADKPVVVRAQVVKVTPSVMDRTWVHLEDGSGSRLKGDYKLVVTTTVMPTLGDIVTVSGNLHKDRDFGGGYKYEVIIEDATFQ